MPREARHEPGRARARIWPLSVPQVLDFYGAQLGHAGWTRVAPTETAVGSRSKVLENGDTARPSLSVSGRPGPRLECRRLELSLVH